MNKNEIFFAENGLTSTSANHIANLAKEYGTRLNGQMTNFQFYNTQVALIGTEDYHQIESGLDDSAVQGLPDIVNKASMLNGLIAWLREAIKAKQNMLTDLERMDVEEYATIVGIDLPERPEQRKPITEDDAIAQLNIKERNRIYTLRAITAKIGQFIHPDGDYSRERKKLQKILSSQFEVKGDGRDTLLFQHTSSCSTDVVEDVFFQLQKQHREAQAELNGILHNIAEKVREDKLSAVREYNIAYSRYSEAIQKIGNDFQLYKEQEAKRIADLRILIPNDLREIYELVNSLGK